MVAGADALIRRQAGLAAHHITEKVPAVNPGLERLLMSRTYKDTPRWVRAARNKQAETVHNGCRNDPSPTPWWRRRRTTTETVTEPVWREETATVKYVYQVPVYDENVTYLGTDDVVDEKEVTRWVFGPDAVTEETFTDVEHVCGIDGEVGRSSCYRWLMTWQEFGNRSRSGLYSSRSARARDRDQLNDLVREFNTFGEVLSDDPAVPRDVCNGRCRSCW